MRPGNAIIECCLKDLTILALDLKATKFEVGLFPFDQVLNTVEMRDSMRLREPLV